jgi:hypothetical protein
MLYWSHRKHLWITEMAIEKKRLTSGDNKHLFDLGAIPELYSRNLGGGSG